MSHPAPPGATERSSSSHDLSVCIPADGWIAIRQAATIMTIARGFSITILSGFAFGVMGTLAGYLLGVIAPDYYRTVFRIPPDMSINLVQAGMGLGATQGVAIGLVVGLVIVVTVAWYNSRMEAKGAGRSGE